MGTIGSKPRVDGVLQATSTAVVGDWVPNWQVETVVLDEHTARAHIFFCGWTVANHVAVMGAECTTIGPRWPAKKRAGRRAGGKREGGQSGGLDPRLAGWGMVCDGGGGLEQLRPHEVLGYLWEAVLALCVEDGVGGVSGQKAHAAW
jgi:hypothetical protein